MVEYRLDGPRGDNPLGFLTALGALVTLEDAGHGAALGWRGVTPRLLVKFNSVLSDLPEAEEGRRRVLAEILHKLLRRERGESAEKVEQAKKEMERAKTAVKKKHEEIRKRKLDRVALKKARELELEPLEQVLKEKTEAFKEHLAGSAADPSVTLGKNLTEANARLIAHAAAACERCSTADRRWADLAAAYGVADPAVPGEWMTASPWALVSGSGHQDFLSSAEQLMFDCAPAHLSRALFGPWEPQDEKYSLRLDTADDRRYALMDRDPTASGNKPLTLWGANRLAFEALRFFPAMPARGGMAVRGWRAIGGDWQEGCRVRWPLWGEPVGVAVVQSLLGLPDLWLEETRAAARLRGRGVHAVMESRRIAIGQGANRKYNLTPAAAVWVSG